MQRCSTTIYRIDGDRLAAKKDEPLPISSAQPVIDVPHRIMALRFARGDSRHERLLYLTQRDAPSSVDDKLDLWSVAPDGSDPRLEQSGAMTLSDVQTSDFRPVSVPGALNLDAQVTGQPGALGIGVASPDRELYAWLFSGIDSNSICVGGPRLSIRASIEERGGCLAEGFYIIPVWVPN